MTKSLSGRIEEFNLVDVVSVIVNGCMEGVLSVETDDNVNGKFAFWKGKLIHATYGNIAGDEAVAHILSWKHGEFFFTNQRWSGVPTVKQNFNQLLLDHSVMMDEATAHIGQSITGTTKIQVKVHPDSLSGVELSSDEWLVISQIEKKTSVAQVLGNLGFSREKSKDILGRLIKLELIEVITERI
ncbi:MAG: DUF4388 domain-containing protein [Caldisericia bacterium]|nr:DUF4388 domain-containing protein [Caldisericia bacterium]